MLRYSVLMKRLKIYRSFKNADLSYYAITGFIFFGFWGFLFGLRKLARPDNPVILGDSLKQVMAQKGVQITDIQAALKTTEPSLLEKFLGIGIVAFIAAITGAVIGAVIALTFRALARRRASYRLERTSQED